MSKEYVLIYRAYSTGYWTCWVVKTCVRMPDALNLYTMLAKKALCK